MEFCGTHLRPVLWDALKISIGKMSLKSTLIRLFVNQSGVDGLIGSLNSLAIQAVNNQILQIQLEYLEL